MNTLNDKQQRFVKEYLVDYNGTQAAIRAGYELSLCRAIGGYYVYALIDSRDSSIFYVGKGSGLRWQAHKKEWLKGHIDNAAKYSKIDQIHKAGGNIVAVFLAKSLRESQAFDIERAFIHRIGLDKLTNSSRGESSYADKIIAWAQSKEMKTYKQWLKEKPRSKFHREIYWNVDKEVKKIIASEGKDTFWLENSITIKTEGYGQNINI